MDRKRRLRRLMWLSATVGTGGALFAVSELSSRKEVDTIVAAAFLLAVAGYFMTAVNYRKIRKEEK